MTLYILCTMFTLYLWYHIEIVATHQGRIIDGVTEPRHSNSVYFSQIVRSPRLEKNWYKGNFNSIVRHQLKEANMTITSYINPKMSSIGNTFIGGSELLLIFWKSLRLWSTCITGVFKLCALIYPCKDYLQNNATTDRDKERYQGSNIVTTLRYF